MLLFQMKFCLRITLIPSQHYVSSRASWVCHLLGRNLIFHPSSYEICQLLSSLLQKISILLLGRRWSHHFSDSFSIPSQVLFLTHFLPLLNTCDFFIRVLCCKWRKGNMRNTLSFVPLLISLWQFIDLTNSCFDLVCFFSNSQFSCTT